MAFTLNKSARGAAETLPVASSGSARQLLSAADQARDDRRWSEAAERYGQYLADRPEDAGIWVQLGHALKESGDMDGAEGAYRHSFELAPDIADTQLQLGHLYKTMRRFSNAIIAYREALRLDDTLVDARRELSNLGVSADEVRLTDALGLLRKPATFIDLSDVFFYLRHHKTVSGIQRVQLGIATAIIAMTTKQRSGILFLSEAEDQLGYVIIDDIFISELAQELSRDEVEHTRLTDIMGSATRRGRPYTAVAGDAMLILGAFWVLQNIAERIIALRRKGVRVGTLIHDIIPITHPEFCERSLTDAFKSYFFSVLSVADFILTVSDHTRRSVEDFVVKSHIPHAPIRTLRSAHKTWDATSRSSSLSPAVARLIKEDYVLYVSTIEIRKNHTYLFRIWKRLLEQIGKKTPKLVFIGRPGWRVNDLMDQLQSTSFLNGTIRILHDLSDVELATLYRSAMFTVFPSFEEGWGLPIGESLIFGRPCIASNTSSVPEVGGDFVDYVDPFNDNDGYEKILRFIQDKDYLEERARHIKDRFERRDWTNVAGDMIALVQSLVGDADVPGKIIEPPQALPGHVYRLGHRDDISRFIESGDSAFVHFACDTGWDSVENFGRWMRGRSGTLEFAIGEGPDEPILVMIELVTVPWLGSTQLQVTVNSVDYPIVGLEPGIRRFLLLHATPENQRVALEFTGTGEIAAGPDARTYLWFGLGSVGYAPITDALARVMLLEQLVFGISGVVALHPTQTA